LTDLFGIMPKKILLFIAGEGYQPMEYSHTKEELEAAGFEVITGSNQAGEAISQDGVSGAKVDVTIDDIKIEDYDGLYVIGGPGALGNLDNEKTYDLLKNWQLIGKPYGSICISTRILAKAGVLQGIQATGWNGDGELPAILVENGAEYAETDVITDGNITTASGPPVAHDFGREIVKVLTE